MPVHKMPSLDIVRETRMTKERMKRAIAAAPQDAPLDTRMYASLASLFVETGDNAPQWRDIAHPFQIPPEGDWTLWLLLAGRGSGKTRAASEFFVDEVASGRARTPGLVGPTAQDAVKIMVQGPAGIIQVAAARGIKAVHEPSKTRVVFPELGVTANIFSAEKPQRLRGPQHDLLWCEEVAAWIDAWKGDTEETTWNNAMFGLRLGEHARAIITTTPKVNKLTKDLIDRAKNRGDVAITKGTTYDNRANLSKNFFSEIISKYEGTRLGRQEIGGELLEDVEGALWQREWLDAKRIHRGDWYPYWLAEYARPKRPPPKPKPSPFALVPESEMPDDSDYEPPKHYPVPPLVRVVVGIDPNMSSDPEADVAGIVVAGLGEDGRGYVLADYSSIFGPTVWAKEAVKAYNYWMADRIIAERNNGGEMVAITIDQVQTTELKPKVDLVWASRGKVTRAEPVAALYEQGKVSHVGEFKELEDELCTFVAGSNTSPGRLDALVWCFTHLFELKTAKSEIKDRRLRVIA